MESAAAKRLDPVRPPTADELPCSDGEPMESDRHFRQRILLIESLELGWKDRDDFFVGGDMFMYFSLAQTKKNDFRGPDVFVVLDTERYRERKSWVVWEEGGRTPDVIIELLSERTEEVDRGEKMHIYSKTLRVSEYFLFDPFTKELEGYRLDPPTRTWCRIEADDNGWLACEQLGLKLGIVPGNYGDIETGWLRWIDPDGHPLPVGQELAEDHLREAARLRIQVERQRAEAERLAVEAAQLREASVRQAARAEVEARRADALQAELDALKRKVESSR